MAYGIAMAVLALLAQAAGPAEKAAADLKSLDAARRLLQNGRYAEAEEAYHGGRGRGEEAAGRADAAARGCAGDWGRPSARPARESMPRRSKA